MQGSSTRTGEERDGQPRAADRPPSHRILVADDDPEIRSLLAEILRLEGYEVDCAENGRAVLEALKDRKRRPSLLLLDLMMPELSGWEVLQSLPAPPGGARGMAVMVLSGVHDSASPVPHVRWMRKPIQPEDLLTAIRATLEPPG